MGRASSARSTASLCFSVTDFETAGRNHRHAVRFGHAGQLRHHARGLADHDEPRALARRSVEYEALKPVTVPSFRGPAKRIDWKLLPGSFREEWMTI